MKIIEFINEIAERGSFSFTKDTNPIKRQLMNKLEAYGLVMLIGKNKYRLSQQGYLAHEKGKFDIPQERENLAQKAKMEKRKIFISHSSSDFRIVEQVIELLEAMGVQSDCIFCSSFEGYGIGLGEDFLKTIKQELDSDVLVLFILSSNFYSSPISLCEMGAAWVQTKDHVPILIPPFGFDDVKGVIPNTQGMKINDKLKLNSLKEKVENFLSLPPKNISAWERKRDLILETINTNLNIVGKQVKDNVEVNESKDSTNPMDEHSIIKRNAKKEWPEDFDMQVHYINKQRNAFNALKNHAPTEISKEEFETIRRNAKAEWPEDFDMQLHYETKQVAKLIELNQM